MTAAIQFQNIKKAYSDKMILEDFNLTIERGEFIGGAVVEDSRFSGSRVDKDGSAETISNRLPNRRNSATVSKSAAAGTRRSSVPSGPTMRAFSGVVSR